MDDEAADDGDWETAWPLGLWRTVALVAAIAFLAGVIGWRIGKLSAGCSTRSTRGSSPTCPRTTKARLRSASSG